MSMSKSMPTLAFLIGGLFILTHCGKKTDAGDTTSSGTSISLPRITGPVETSAQSKLHSIQPLAIGLPLSQAYPSPNPSPTQLKTIFEAANTYINQGQLADQLSCIFEKLSSSGLVKTTGIEYVMQNTNEHSATKFMIDYSNGNLNNYKMFSCSGSGATSNIFYLSGSSVNGAASFTFKVNLAGVISFASNISGTFTNNQWQNKTAAVQANILGLIQDNYTLTQQADHMTIAQTRTLFGTSTHLFSAFNLYGNSKSTYELGSGSLKFCTLSSGVCGSDTLEHWGDNGTTTTDSLLSSLLSGNNYPTSLAAVFDQPMTTEETWDCSTGSANTIDQTSFSAELATSISTSCGTSP